MTLIAPPALGPRPQRRWPLWLLAFLLLALAIAFSPKWRQRMMDLAHLGGRFPPAVLICVPERESWWNGWVDLGYLRSLRAAGFDVDFTDPPGGLTWDRIAKYDCLVVFHCPRPPAGPDPGPLIDKFVQQGGGLLIFSMPDAPNDSLQPLLARWGVRRNPAPYAGGDPKTTVPLGDGLRRFQMALTRDIATHPATHDVHALWLPVSESVPAAVRPLTLSREWTPLVRGAPPVQPPAPPHSAPPKPAEPPVVAGARSYGKGRLVVVSQSPEFTIGQGNQWPHWGRFLARGVNGTPSDFDHFLKSSLRWLSETKRRPRQTPAPPPPPERFIEPNTTLRARTLLAESTTPPSPAPAAPGKVFRGLFGAQSSFSALQFTVAQMGAAALSAGLNFLVFTEDFQKLDPDKLKQLIDVCHKTETAELRLVPGFIAPTNLGGHLFVWGNPLPWPPKECLTGPNKDTIVLRSVDGQGHATVHEPSQAWLRSLQSANTGAGFVADAGLPWPVSQLRPLGAVAVSAYRHGKASHDGAAEYRDAIAQYIPVLPVGLSIVSTPDELRAAVEGSQALTVVHAKALAEVFPQILRWPAPREFPDVSMTEGPIVESWAGVAAVRTDGAVPGMLGRAFTEAKMDLSSKRPIKEVTIWDGNRLWRRYDLSGESPTKFVATIPLCALAQHALTLEVRDAAGSRAISTPFQCFKEGGMEVAPDYDRLSDDQKYFAHPVALGRPAPVSIGYSSPDLPRTGLGVLAFNDWDPVLVSSAGTTGDRPVYGIARIEAADEQAATAHFRFDSFLDIPRTEGVPALVSAAASTAATCEIFFTQFCRPAVGPTPVGPPGRSLRTGPTAALLSQRFLIAGEQMLQSIRWLSGRSPAEAADLKFWMRRPSGDWSKFDISRDGPYRVFPVPERTWFCFHSDTLGRSILFLNRNRPFSLQIDPQNKNIEIRLFSELFGSMAHPDDRIELELQTWTDPTDSGSDFAKIKQLVDNLQDPGEIKVSSGKLLASKGMLDVDATGGVASVEMTAPIKPTAAALPIRVRGLNPVWSAFAAMDPLIVKAGTPRISPVSVDSQGYGYLVVDPDRTTSLRVDVGHPVVASDTRVHIDAVPRRMGGKLTWLVQVHNPLAEPLTVDVMASMRVPGLNLARTRLELKPWSVVNLVQ